MREAEGLATSAESTQSSSDFRMTAVDRDASDELPDTESLYSSDDEDDIHDGRRNENEGNRYNSNTIDSPVSSVAEALAVQNKDDGIYFADGDRFVQALAQQPTVDVANDNDDQEGHVGSEDSTEDVDNDQVSQG